MWEWLDEKLTANEKKQRLLSEETCADLLETEDRIEKEQLRARLRQEARQLHCVRDFDRICKTVHGHRIHAPDDRPKSHRCHAAAGRKRKGDEDPR